MSESNIGAGTPDINMEHPGQEEEYAESPEFALAERASTTKYPVVPEQSEELVLPSVLIDCPKCGQRKPAHHVDTHICADCAKAINSRITYYRQHRDWMAEAREQGLDVWLQQPGETQWEYTIWLAYRDSYPGRKPSYKQVAQQLGTTYTQVLSVAKRWDFQARMQVWISECDRITLLQRRNQILDMNRDHISMAEKLREKLKTAIEKIEPANMKPGEIASLMKVATELERKARIDEIAQDEMRANLLVDTGNPDLKKTPTKQGDLAEVVQILMKAGALGSITAIGVKETTTRETIIKGPSGEALLLEDGAADE
jgi:ribosomal protein L32